MQAPKSDHMLAVKHIFRYIKATTNYGIFYPRGAPLILTDADWASCPSTRRSAGAYVISLGGHPISWHSKRQQTTSKSSTESEYMALSTSTQKAVYLRRLLAELPLPSLPFVFLSCKDSLIPQALPSSPPVLHCDNQGVIKLAKNPVFHARTKHIEVHHHFVREHVLEGRFYFSTSAHMNKQQMF